MLHVPTLHLFLSMSSILVYIHITDCFHSLVDGHLACFQFLAITDETAMDIHIQVFAWT